MECDQTENLVENRRRSHGRRNRRETMRPRIRLDEVDAPTNLVRRWMEVAAFGGEEWRRQCRSLEEV
jgi:hypothetical protein